MLIIFGSTGMLGSNLKTYFEQNWDNDDIKFLNRSNFDACTGDIDDLDKLFKFLSGWLGGPDLFIQQYGHPRLRQRHFSFKVNQQVRDQWVFCMRKALYEIAMPDEVRKNIKQAIDDLATHMINADS